MSLSHPSDRSLSVPEAFDALLAHAQVGCVFLDRQLRYLKVNDVLAAMNGMSAADHIGRKVEEVVPTLVATLREVIERILATGGPVEDHEFTGETPAAPGEQRHWLETWFPVHGEGGEIVAFGGVVTEITEQRRAEAALRGSKHFLQRVTDVSPAVLYVFDLEKEENVFTSRAVATVLGYSPEELPDMGENLLPQLIHPDDLPRLREHFTRVSRLRNDESLEFEHRMRTKTGEWRWLHNRDTVFTRDAAGEVQQIIGASLDLTEGKSREIALRDSERRLRLATEAAGLGIWRWDREQDAVVWENERAYAIFGLPVGEPPVTAARFRTDFIHPDDVPSFEAGLGRALAAGEHFSYRCRIRRADGAERWIELTGQRAPETTDLTDVVGTVQDITEQVQARERERQNAVLFTRIIEQAPMGVYVVDAQFRFQQVNSLAAPVFAKVDRLMGRPFNEVMEVLWGPEVAAEVVSHFRHTLETGERYVSPRFVEQRVDVGMEQAYEWETQRVLLPDGQHGVVCYFNEVTEQLHAAERTLASEQRMRLAIEATGVGIWEWNLSTNEVHWDAQMFRIYGLEPTPDMRVSYGTWRATVHPADVEAQEVILQSTARTSGHSCRIFRILRASDGVERCLEAVETVRLNAHGKAQWVVGTNLDITERRNAEIAVRQAKEAAEAANQSKDHFLAVLSHELRTPLTPVLMALGELQRDPRLEPAVREDVEMMRRNIDLETKLIDDLLDLNRVSAGKLALDRESVDLNDLVRRVCRVSQPQVHEAGLRLYCDLGESVGCVSADPARLQQVLWNVLRNAIKFTPEGGHITVRTACLDHHRCEVRVHDTGRGMSPETLPRIFEAFEQGGEGVTRQFGGLGLGLAICKALLALHDGSIRAESEGEGRGATFIIELPLLAEEPVAAPLPSAAADPGATARPRLLLVEDHEDTAQALARLLKRAGYPVKVAHTVAEALAVAQREPFDILVSDLGLPDGTGNDLIRQLSKTETVRGIAMSGYGMDEDIQRSRDAGFAEHLVKPLDLPRLEEAIRRVMRKAQLAAKP